MKQKPIISTAKIRTLDFKPLQIGADSAQSFMSENENITKPLFALEIPFFKEESGAPILKEMRSLSFEESFVNAQNSCADLICVEFNFPENNFSKNLDLVKKSVKQFTKNSQKPLILKGSGNIDTDKILLPELAKCAQTQVIIAYAEEKDYESILPSVIEFGHVVVLRTPIDINLTKELNILSSDAGLPLDKIIIDTDMGALGYGLDYGFSIIEKIRQAGLSGDLMLNMPIITFIGSETYKVKETKTEKLDGAGLYSERAVMWEISAVSAVISAGANIAVCSHPKTIEVLKEVLWN